MQINVISGGEQAIKNLMYPPPDPGLLEYLQNGINRAAEIIGDGYNGFIDGARNLYEKYNGENVLRAGKAVLYNSGTAINHDTIYPVQYNETHNANTTMQRYIMSNPEVSKLAKRNSCHGFEETYYDPQPGVYGKDRDDYNRVMDGIIQTDKDDEYCYVEYFTSSEDDRPLDSFDQFTILETWDNVNRMIAEGLDPTDPEEGEL